MIKRAVTAVVAVMLLTGVALANGNAEPSADGLFAFGGLGGAIVGSDGSLYLTREASSSTRSNRVFEVVAIRSTGTTAFTTALPSGADHVELSGSNLLAVTDTTASRGASPTSAITAISTASGATAWTLNIDGRVTGILPFNGGTYVTFVKPAATSGGTATRTLEAVSDSGAVLWSMAL